MDTVKTGKFIAQLRHEQGLTQQQLADKLGVTDKTISRWENANYMPDISMLQELSAVLGVNESELLCGERKAHSAPVNSKLISVLLFIFRIVVLPLSFALPTIFAWYIYICIARFVPYDELFWELFRISMVIGSAAWILLTNKLHKRSAPLKVVLIITAAAIAASIFGILIFENVLLLGWGTVEQLVTVFLAYLVSRILSMRFNNK